MQDFEITNTFRRFAFLKSQVLIFIIAVSIIGCSSGSNSEPSVGKPEMNRFMPVVLGGQGLLDEPMAFDIAQNGKIYIIERKGGFKVYDPNTDAISEIATINVNTKYTNYDGEVSEAEEGLIGFILDPDFEENNWAYFLYADPDSARHNLSRFELMDGELIMESERLLLDYPVQRNYCCHTGGGMDWDADGNLYIAIGNNTRNSQGSQTNQRPGMEYRDDQRGAANTNDLRGKIIRIHPEDDGTYSIPEGNLFEPDAPHTRSEIYAMGLRNPWRISIDRENGYIYWGEVGPDASEDTEIGPRGYDEFNQAREPGFFGWPYFIGPNDAYPIYDYANDTIGEPKDPESPTNLSRNNDGLQQLPPATPAFIYYPYAASEEFPGMGTGSRSASGNRVYHRSAYRNAEEPYPAYYEDKLFMTDFARQWIMVVSMDEDGTYQSMEEFLPDYDPSQPIDMDFGPDGQLYVLEYGSNVFQYSPNSKLVRIEYNSGNRRPDVVASASSKGGRLPLILDFSSRGTVDYDGDELTYSWKITREDGTLLLTFNTPNPTARFDEPGVYTATLTVTDSVGLTNSNSVQVVAGNDAPNVSFNLSGSNRSFFFPGETIDYSVTVNDEEDGSLSNGSISPEAVAISIDYASEGFDFAEVAQRQRSMDTNTRFFVARTMIENSDCATCHQITTASVGPAYIEVAERYADDPEARDYLADKIINGGSGVWGEATMAAHPEISQSDARLIAEYILDINEDTLEPLPAEGSYTLEIPEGDNGRGSFVFRAAYRDTGADGAPPVANEDIVVLQSPRVGVAKADIFEDVELEYTSGPQGRRQVIQPKKGSYIAFQRIDLTGIRQLEFDAHASARSGHAGGVIETRLGSPGGELLGSTEVRIPEGGGGFGESDIPVHLSLGRELSGIHNLYFVFKNSEARDSDPLMSISTISFVDTGDSTEEE